MSAIQKLLSAVSLQPTPLESEKPAALLTANAPPVQKSYPAAQQTQPEGVRPKSGQAVFLLPC